MEWLNDAWVQVSAFIVAATLVAIALKKFWQSVLVPMWAAMKAAVKLAEIHHTVVKSEPILQELVEQFKPNGGVSIHDHITRLDRRQQTIDEKLDTVINMVDTHITQTRPGGRRATDPQ